MKKESTTKLKPTTLMARDLTLKGLFAKESPDVPAWFSNKIEDGNHIFKDISEEEIYIQWLEYYSELMIKHFSK